jgi:hypothetical protein
MAAGRESRVRGEVTLARHYISQLEHAARRGQDPSSWWGDRSFGKGQNHAVDPMNGNNSVLGISLFVIALFAGPGVTRAQTGTTADVVSAIINLENDGVKADLAGDAAFYQKVLARVASGAKLPRLWRPR